MTEPEVAANRSRVGLTERPRARLAAVVREDLARGSIGRIPVARALSEFGGGGR